LAGIDLTKTPQSTGMTTLLLDAGNQTGSRHALDRG
jgi:hypothetical protein